MKVLYLGMANDIMSPLLLIPETTIIYAIDSFDSCYSRDGTWDTQKKDIQQILIQGNDLNTFSYDIHTSDTDDKEPHYLKHKSKILNSVDDGSVWTLEFLYGTGPITLKYYHHYNFYSEWPDEITEISKIIGIGADVYWPVESEANDCNRVSPKRCKILLKQFHERTHPKMYTLYALSFLHENWPERAFIQNGREREGNEISIWTISI